MEKKGNDITETAKIRALRALEYAMGTSILDYMRDDRVNELMVNPDGKLWIDTFDQGTIFSGVIMKPEMSKNIIYKVAALSGQTIDLSTVPALQAEIPSSYLFDSARFQGELPQIVTAPSFNIRKYPKVVLTLDNYVEKGVMTQKQKDVILKAVRDKKNIIAAGGTSSGKTTLLNAILLEIAEMSERVVLIEDTPELRCSSENCVSFRTMPTVDMDMLLRFTLRKSPKRIVVGEVRSKEALTLLDAWSTGHRGGCSTVHSDSAYDTLYRLESMVSRVSLTPQSATIARAVDVVVYLKYDDVELRRWVEDIIEVTGYDVQRQEYITKKIDMEPGGS